MQPVAEYLRDHGREFFAAVSYKKGSAGWQDATDYLYAKAMETVAEQLKKDCSQLQVELIKIERALRRQ